MSKSARRCGSILLVISLLLQLVQHTSEQLPISTETGTRYLRKTKTHQQQYSVAFQQQQPVAYRQLMYPGKRTYSNHCRSSKLFNETWGEAVAPYVDKLTAKEVVRAMKVVNLKLVPTVAHYTAQNISEFTLDSLKDFPVDFIVKATHTSGGVARVFNGTYQCFKLCSVTMEDPLPVEQAFSVMKGNMQADLDREYFM